MRIVLIEDDLDAREIFEMFLAANGFEVYSASNGSEGIEEIQIYAPDLVILDIELPVLNGWEVCRRIRTFSGVPILMISAVARSDHDVILGLNSGADDYLIKPFALGVLKARIEALLRRSVMQNDLHKIPGYVDSHLMVDLRRERVHVNGDLTSLTFLEFRLLALLVSRIDYVVSLSTIIEILWYGETDESYAQYARVYVQRLRKMIEPDPSHPRYIITEHGIGYRFNSQI